MKEKDEVDFGLEGLNDYEYGISGGVSLQKIVEILGKLYFYAEQAEKYWPAFREGFQKGWEAA
jgi:hypothetical protein